MVTQSVSISEFASLVQKLQQSPDDSKLKTAVVGLLPEMRHLAKTQPMAGYYLAHTYSPNSQQYRQAMVQSADLGCTNAMLAASEFLARSNHPENLQKAADYIKRIKLAPDSYIKTNLEKLLARYPKLDTAVQNQQTKTAGADHIHRFFPTASGNKEGEMGLEDKETYQP